MLKFGLASIFFLFLLSDWVFLASFLILFTLIWFCSIRNYNLGVVDLVQIDIVSYLLGGLSLWVTCLIVLIRFYIKFTKNFPKIFLSLCLFILFFLLLRFSTSNFLIYYISFERTLIPIFLLILGWGYQPERVSASYFLLFYTLLASLPLLLRIIWINLTNLRLDYFLLSFLQLDHSILFFCLTLAFFVKIPAYLGHIWLPKAHVEAPVAGSIILAGILLKLGGYGLYRVLPFLQTTLETYSVWLIVLFSFGGIIASLICIRQTDCKSLVAYSSVAHIALVLVGLVISSTLSVGGAVIIIIAHGLCSSGLFRLVGIIYERTGTRSLVLLRGIIVSTPILTLWWFLFRIRNIAAPPTPRLAGEIYLFISSITWSWLAALFVGVLSFLAGAYNLYLFISTQHGNKISSRILNVDSLIREHLVLFLHFIPFLLLLPVLVNIYCYWSSLIKNMDLWCPRCNFLLLIMIKSVYQKISFFLFNIIIVIFFSRIFLAYYSKSFFFEWIIGGSYISFSATILLDFISTLFMRVVFCISSRVVWYSIRYMGTDKDAVRFIYVVFGFVISIVLLILSPNILRILLGWDGLGLISYCLVVYYPTKKSNRAGILTVLRNRVGDVCVLFSFAWFGLLGDFNFSIWTLYQFKTDRQTECKFISLFIIKKFF